MNKIIMSGVAVLAITLTTVTAFAGEPFLSGSSTNLAGVSGGMIAGPTAGGPSVETGGMGAGMSGGMGGGMGVGGMGMGGYGGMSVTGELHNCGAPAAVMVVPDNPRLVKFNFYAPTGQSITEGSGMLAPTNEGAALSFSSTNGIPALFTAQGKVAMPGSARIQAGVSLSFIVDSNNPKLIHYCVSSNYLAKVESLSNGFQRPVLKTAVDAKGTILLNAKNLANISLGRGYHLQVGVTALEVAPHT